MATRSIDTDTNCPMADLNDHLPSWSAVLKENAQQHSIQNLFSQDPERATKFSCRSNELFLDYSKSHLSTKTRALLIDVAREAKLDRAINNLLGGAKVNSTENRAAWHTLLRHPSTKTDENSSPEAQAVKTAKSQMKTFVDSLTQGPWRGFNDKRITDVVNIGIGGSDLGPRMVSRSLCDFHQEDIKVHFVANIDGAEIFHTLNKLNPEQTLFIVASKSFTTQETLANATTARQWLLEHHCPEDQLHKHIVAISTNTRAACNFGIAEENIFPMWDWVGGRYSLWSTIGLPIAIAVGWDNFEELLAGAHSMDQHFHNTEFSENMPVLLALLTFWYNQCQNSRSQAILPYCHQLNLLPDFLQQLDMESVGKGVNLDGQKIGYSTGLIIWGTEESNGQHSFHQLFHQGTQVVPIDFIATLNPNHPLDSQHQQLLINCLSQGQALMQGKTLATAYDELIAAGKSSSEANALAPHKVIDGNKPSNTIIMNRMTPKALGELIALYEHKVFCLSVLLNVNAFDQWGVELGKQLSQEITQALDDNCIPSHWDSSTRQLAEMILKQQP